MGTFYRSFGLLGALLVVAGLLPDAVAERAADLQSTPARRAVLVTGASSGSGRMIAETLASNGYSVYAGARKPEDLRALDVIPNIRSVRLDVTVQDEIDAAVDLVREAGQGLYAVINNAGVGLMAPLIELDEGDLDFIFDVNVYGPFRISKAFAPLLIESRGRVINIGSIAGFQTRTFYGPYSMSKHALEAFNDALAIELERFGVQVSIIDPGGFSSNIGKNIYNRLKARGLNFEDSLYSEDWAENWVIGGGDLSAYKGPEDIVRVVQNALADTSPRRRYMVVGDAGRADSTVRAILRRMLELNRDQPFSYSREDLVKMLDEEMAALR